MSTTSESRAEAPLPSPRGTLVWDAPVRAFHGLMVLAFAGAWLTAESERWRLVHVTLGYTMAGLVAFRLAWGLVGTRHARFASFVRGPAAVGRYLVSLVRGRPERHVGHNPAGAVAIVGLLALAALVTFSGWATYAEQGGRLAEELHEGIASVMLALVGVHVAGVVVSSLAHRENLVVSMLTGRKRVDASEGIRSPWRSVAAMVLAAVLGFWWVQLREAPGGPPGIAATALEPGHDED
ncbi:MAG TPA: cytochrome b/b6 domain-containing protein [Usitatibacter sp.]|nr:cytochrome b/b6 domain-containing protein [Usitatibacter sp.]